MTTERVCRFSPYTTFLKLTPFRARLDHSIQKDSCVSPMSLTRGSEQNILTESSSCARRHSRPQRWRTRYPQHQVRRRPPGRRHLTIRHIHSDLGDATRARIASSSRASIRHKPALDYRATTSYEPATSVPSLVSGSTNPSFIGAGDVYVSYGIVTVRSRECSHALFQRVG